MGSLALGWVSVSETRQASDDPLEEEGDVRKRLLALAFAMLMGLAGVACEGNVDVGDGEGGDNGVELEGELGGEGEGEGEGGGED